MVLMEESGLKPTQVTDSYPDGLDNIVEISQILEASHVSEVGDDAHTLHTHMHQLVVKPSLSVCLSNY